MNTANIFASILFGSIGLAAFIYGKKQASFKAMTIGILLMVYPYFTSNAFAVYAVGVALVAMLFIF